MKYVLSTIIALLALSGAYSFENTREQKQRIQEAEAAITAMQLVIAEMEESPPNVGADNVTLAGLQTYYLHGSGVSSSDTSMTLSSLTIPQNSYKIQDSDMSATFYLTIEPGNRTRQEFISCTTVTQNAAGTASLSGCTRGLAPITPYTASSSLQFPHSGGSAVIFSNPPQVYNQAAFKDNDETITGTWTFTSTAQAVYNAAPTFSNALALITKGYADALVAAGVATSSESQFGGVWLGTALQSASSTNGGVNQPYVMQTRYATDTPQSGCASGYSSTAGAGCTPIATLGGKLRQSWLDLTEAFTVSGAWIFSSTATFNATTTIAASNVNSNALNLNGLAYQWPSTRGNARTFLTDNGSGVLSFASSTAYNLFATTTAFSTTGSTVTNIFGTTTIPTGTISTNTTIHGRFDLSIQDVSANTKNLTLYLGSTECGTGGVIDLGGSTYAGILDFMIVTGVSATAQECSFSWTIPGNITYFFTGSGSASIDNSAAATNVSVFGRNVDSNDVYTIQRGFIEVTR